MNDLIRVVQLPVIEEHLRGMKDEVDKQAAEALSLACTVDTLQAVKAKRSELNKQFQELETLRKSVKKAVLEPYKQFERTYEECVSRSFQACDAELKAKIGDVEQGIKQQCENRLREYFTELCSVYHVEFLAFEQSGVVIDMASAKQKTPNKLRKQILDFVSRVSSEIKTIYGMKDAEEILVEYRQNLNLSESVATVQERRQRIEEEREAKASNEEIIASEEETVRRVESAAQTIVPPAEIVRVTFTVVDTKQNAIKVREFMKQEGIRYE